jgi:hypothetical protein
MERGRSQEHFGLFRLRSSRKAHKLAKLTTACTTSTDRQVDSCALGRKKGPIFMESERTSRPEVTDFAGMANSLAPKGFAVEARLSRFGGSRVGE